MTFDLRVNGCFIPETRSCKKRQIIRLPEKQSRKQNCELHFTTNSFLLKLKTRTQFFATTGTFVCNLCYKLALLLNLQCLLDSRWLITNTDKALTSNLHFFSSPSQWKLVFLNNVLRFEFELLCCIVSCFKHFFSLGKQDLC